MARNISLGVGGHILPSLDNTLRSVVAQVRNVQSGVVQGIRDSVSAVKQAYAQASSIKSTPASEAVTRAIAAMEKVSRAGKVSSADLGNMASEVAQAIAAIGQQAGIASEDMANYEKVLEQVPPDVQNLIETLRNYMTEVSQSVEVNRYLENALRNLSKASEIAASSATEAAAAEQSKTQAQSEAVATTEEVVSQQQREAIATEQITQAKADLTRQIELLRSAQKRESETHAETTKQVNASVSAIANYANVLRYRQQRLNELIPALAEHLGVNEQVVRSTLRAAQAETQETAELNRLTDAIGKYIGMSGAAVRSALKRNTAETQQVSLIQRVVKWIREKIRATREEDAVTRSSERTQENMVRVLRTTVHHSYKTVRALDVMMSAFQGIQLSTALLSGSFQGVGMSLFFMRMSIIPLVAVFASLTMAIQLVTKTLGVLKKALAESGRQAQDTLVQFRALANDTLEGTRAWIVSTDWAIRYGRSLDEVRGAMTGFWKQGLLNEDMMKASIALASAWNMELNEAVNVLANAVGKEKQNVESLREYGIVIDDVTDGMSRMEVASLVAQATLERFGDSIDAKLRTISGASQRAKSAIAGFWETFTEPLATGVIAPLINTFANFAASLMMLVRGLWMSSQAQDYFNTTLDKARGIAKKYRPEIEILGNIVRLVVVGAFWMLQRALRFVVDQMERFFRWVRGIIAANTALGRTLKPLIDMLRMLSNAFKNLTFTDILTAFKKMFYNLLSLLGPFGEWIEKMFASIATVWEKNSNEFISNALLTLFAAKLWKKFFPNASVNPIRAAITTFLFNIIGEAFIESLPAEDWVKSVLNRIFDFTVWGTAIGGIVGGPWGALIGGVVGTIVGVLDEKLGLGIGNTIRNLIPKTKEDWTNLWNTGVKAWNSFWDWVNREMWPGMGEIATSFASWLQGDINFSTLLDNIKETFQKGFGGIEINIPWLNTLKENIQNKIAEIKAAFREHFPGIAAYFDNLGETVKTWGVILSDIWANISPTLEPLMRIFKSLFKLLEGGLVKTGEFVGIFFKAWSIGVKMFLNSGFYDSVKGLVALLTGALSAAFQAVMIPINFVLTLLTEGWSAAVKNFQGDAARLWKTLRDAATKVRKYFGDAIRKTLNRLSTFGSDLRKGWREIWNDLKDWFRGTFIGQLYKTVTKVFKDIWDFLFGKSWDDDVLDSWKTLWNEIHQWFDSSWAGKALNSITSWFDDVLSNTENSLSDTESAFQSGWNNISDWWNRTWSSNSERDVRSYGNKVKRSVAGYDVASPWQNVWGQTTDWFSRSFIVNAHATIMNFGQSVKNIVAGMDIVSAWRDAWGRVNNWFSGTFVGQMLGHAVSWLNSMVSTISSQLSAVRYTFTSILGILPSTLYSLGVNIVQGLYSGANSALRYVVQLLYSIKSSFSRIIGNTNLWSIGYNIMQGLWQGLMYRWNSILSWLYSIARTISNVFRSVTRTHSPSRVMMEIGQDIANGLLIGMQGMVDGTRQIANDVNKELSFGDTFSRGAFPAPATLVGRGGGNTIVINITGNNFGAGADGRDIANDIADELVTRLNLRGVMIERRF